MIELHKESYSTALLRGQADKWDKSFLESRKCFAFLIDKINEKIDELDEVPESCIKAAIKEFGFDRTMWVIANTIMSPDNSRHNIFSVEARNWAKNFGVDYGDENLELPFGSYVINQLLKQVRKLYQGQDFYNGEDISEDGDYKNKIVVLKPSMLTEEYRTKENQLFYATCGFGCDPSKIGRKVMGFFLLDGERTSFYREDFLGIMKPELVPEWAQNNLEKILAGEEIEQSADAPADAPDTINQQNM